MWATADESTEFIVGHYRRTCTESDKVIADFRLEDTGSRWKGDPISLRQAIVSMIGETARHAGHADIIRELIDGSASCHPGQPFLTGKVRRWLDKEVSWLERQDLPLAVVHRDIRAEHLYVDDNGDLVGVIDFGDTTIDDPALDLAKIAGDFGDPFLDLVLAHYRGPADQALLARAQLYRRLDTLWEVAEDAWGDRPAAIRRLRSLAAAAARAGQPRRG